MENKIISIDIIPGNNEEITENAGVMWEHNATTLVFNLAPDYVGDYRYYIEYRSLLGTKVRTEYLDLTCEDNTVSYMIPVTMSSLKGVECYFNIVSIDTDGNTIQVIKPKKFCLTFDYSPDTDNSIAKVNDFSVNALLEAIRLNTFKGDKGDKGEKGAQGEKGDKGDRGDDGDVTEKFVTDLFGEFVEKIWSTNILNKSDSDFLTNIQLGVNGVKETVKTGWNTTGFMAVTFGESLVVSAQARSNPQGRLNVTGTSRIYAYDKDKQFIDGSYSSASSGILSYSIPEGACFVRVSYSDDVLVNVMVEKGTTFSSEYAEYGYTLLLKNDVKNVPRKISELENDVGFITKENLPEYNVPTALSQLENDTGFITEENIKGFAVYENKALALPKTMYAFVNQPIKIYFHNIADYNFDDLYVNVVTTPANSGELYSDRWEYTPIQSGTLTVTISIYDHYYNQLNKETFTFNVVDTSEKTNVTVLVIGDSTVNASVETRQMLSLAENDGFSLTLLGTRNADDDKDINQHEGRGGWDAKMYCETESASSGRVVNEFYNTAKAGTNKFDFSYYMTNQGYSGVDCVFLQLGINDMFSANSDSQANTSKSEYLSYIESMVRNIHSYDENSKIVLNLIIPCSVKQENFARAKQSGAIPIRAPWRVRRNTYLANLDVITTLKENLSDITNVYISPFNASLDVVNNMAYHVHPTEDGYKELGTQMYSTLRAII